MYEEDRERCELYILTVSHNFYTITHTHAKNLWIRVDKDGGKSLGAACFCEKVQEYVFKRFRC